MDGPGARGRDLAASCGSAPAPTPVTIQAARAELRDLIVDVTAATAYRYKLTDDQGHHMGPTDVVWVPEARLFAGVFFAWDDRDQVFHLHVATSLDLMAWTWEVELAQMASQPAIAAMSDGGYVVAWEQEPDPIHMVIESFATWDDLRAGTVKRRFDVPITMPACGEGTPSIESASSQRVDLSFHYHGGCDLDRQASGSTDWTTWHVRRTSGTGPGADRPGRGEPCRRPGHDLVPWPRPDAHRGRDGPRRLELVAHVPVRRRDAQGGAAPVQDARRQRVLRESVDQPGRDQRAPGDPRDAVPVHRRRRGRRGRGAPLLPGPARRLATARGRRACPVAADGARWTVPCRIARWLTVAASPSPPSWTWIGRRQLAREDASGDVASAEPRR